MLLTLDFDSIRSELTSRTAYACLCSFRQASTCFTSFPQLFRLRSAPVGSREVFSYYQTWNFGLASRLDTAHTKRRPDQLRSDASARKESSYGLTVPTGRARQMKLSGFDSISVVLALSGPVPKYLSNSCIFAQYVTTPILSTAIISS